MLVNRRFWQTGLGLLKITFKCIEPDPGANVKICRELFLIESEFINPYGGDQWLLRLFWPAL
jgi:hypothetical protein